MNNAGFVIMRYLRDLGADAYLLTFSTDGSDNLSHFAPESDTWDIDRWTPFIRHLKVPNNSGALIGGLPYFGSRSSGVLKKDLLLNYDFFIGSGSAPALFEKMNLKLDIFWPYGAGIEFYGDLEFKVKSKSSLLRRLVYSYIRRLQSNGISNTRYCLNAEMSITKDSFEEIGKSFLRLPVPAIYNREEVRQAILRPKISDVIEQIESYDFSIFNCSRLLWDKNTLMSEAGENWRSFSKNSDWLFIGFAQFIRENPLARSVLVCVEYGPDIHATKQLVSDLGIEQHVIWLPILQRKEIILLLKACDIGVGEFYTDPGVIWGGTGWEVLSCGKPFLQGFNFSKESFESEFGYPPPPILDVKSSRDVAHHLSSLFSNVDRRNAIHKEMSDWFKRYNGIGLAKQWLSLLQKNDEEI